MEQANRMVGQRFKDHNQNFDKGENLNIYTCVCQGQVMYTQRYKEEISCKCWHTNLRIPRVLNMLLAKAPTIQGGEYHSGKCACERFFHEYFNMKYICIVRAIVGT